MTILLFGNAIVLSLIVNTFLVFQTRSGVHLQLVEKIFGIEI